MSGKSVEALFNSNSLSVITFSTTDASFAIPLDQVLYIEKDVKRNLQLDELEQFNHEVITFQNKTVQLYDFNRLIGSENHGQIMGALISQFEANEKSHAEWLEHIEAAIQTKTSIHATQDLAVEEIKHWISSVDIDNEEIMETVHKIGDYVLKLQISASRSVEQAKTNDQYKVKQFREENNAIIKEMTHLFHTAKERAANSVRPIIIFVEHDNSRTTALRLDNINDIVNYDLKNFCRDESTDGIMKRDNDDFVIEGFLRNGDGPPCLLINCQPMANAVVGAA